MLSKDLLLDRLEFKTIKIDSNVNWEAPTTELTFPQLSIDPRKLKIQVRSGLAYPDNEIENPSTFIVEYGIAISNSQQKKENQIPYDIEVNASAWMTYEGGDLYQGADRFRAVRQSGFSILYGAIREMVCNLTARGHYGMWQLPAQNFSALAKKQAATDEAKRQEALAERRQPPSIDS